MPGDIDEPILLYKGPFSLVGVEPSEPPFVGDIRFLWKPTPRIQVRGERELGTADLLNTFMAEPSNDLWVEYPTVVLPSSTVIPGQPAEPSGGASGKVGTTYVNQALGSQEFGDSTDLDRLTFLVPNGWLALDGHGICDGENLMRLWHGRTSLVAGDWTITLDARPELQISDFQRELTNIGGHYISHIGEIRRSDQSRFTASEALQGLEIVRLAFSIALGRNSNCILPVGWQDDIAIWTQWCARPIDPYRQVSSWLDESIANKQVSQLLASMMNYCADPYRREVVRYATSYYVTANFDLDVELAVAVPVSGMQLLAYYRFVEDRETLTSKEFDALKGKTEEQIRRLLDDCQIDTTIPPHFTQLSSFAAALPSGFTGRRDGLGVVVYLRNRITHPTKQKPGKWGIYGWAEASMLARHYLALTILNTVGYQGEERSPLTGSSRIGQVTPVPWA